MDTLDGPSPLIAGGLALGSVSDSPGSMCGRVCQCENAVGVMMCAVVCGRSGGGPASVVYVRCGMCALGGPSMLISGGLALGSWRPRLHNVPRHAWRVVELFLLNIEHVGARRLDLQSWSEI